MPIEDYNGYVPTVEIAQSPDAREQPPVPPNNPEWCGVMGYKHVGARDSRGRVMVTHLSDRELLVEILTKLRDVTDGIEQMSEAAQGNPMLKGLLGL